MEESYNAPGLSPMLTTPEDKGRFCRAFIFCFIAISGFDHPKPEQEGLSSSFPALQSK
jgi:hypothetical protein